MTTGNRRPPRDPVAEVRGESRLPRILIVSTDYGPPWEEGEKNIARVLESALSQQRWQGAVCSNLQSDIEAGPHHRGSLRELRTSVRFWLHAARTARRQGVSVVHLLSSVSSLLGVKCQVIKRLSGASLLLHVTGLATPMRGYRLGLRADRIVVGGSYLQPLFPGAVNLPPISPHVNPHLDRETAHGPRGGTPRRILYLGAMEPERGVHTLIDALAVLRAELGWSDFTATLAWNGHGSKAYVALLRERVRAQALDEHVRWEGVVSDLGTLYRTHDCVVIPHAGAERMGFPLRLIEALSYGKPVVVSDVGEMPRVVDGCGLVFPRGSTQGLARALRRLLSDGNLYRRSIVAAYEAAQQYDNSRTVGRFLELYRELAHAS